VFLVREIVLLQSVGADDSRLEARLDARVCCAYSMIAEAWARTGRIYRPREVAA
jgi:hypothetical protein